ncbi:MULTISPECIES: phage major capsid protein [unclassified Micrococcus]|uniref:phage major capsid protein n=1 Tax=unclassified Micrococcus TaxID=2620948 RepID=UPI00077DF128|nr:MULTISPECIES: phage major capsid protein [unclassified Micrococcus]KYK00836.1 major capsid protein [Micrococcus sp. CH3]KYK04843.1 major capsid protein [Micrococcus sp. CH7]
MSKLKQLQEAAQAAAKAARETAEKADREGRALTDAERTEYDQHMAKGRDLLEQIKVAKRDAEVLDQAKSLAQEIGGYAVDDIEGQKDAGTPTQRVKNLGLEVISSPQFKAMMKGFTNSDGTVRIPDRTQVKSDPIHVKSLFTGASGTSAGAFVTPEQTGIIEMLGRRPLTIRDLISVRRTGSDTLEYVRQTAHTNAAKPVPEAQSAAPIDGTTVTNVIGGLKPEGSWAFERVSTSVKTIAEWVPVTKRALADAAQLEDLIRDELSKDIAEAEEAQILTGDGVGENLTGILSTSGIQSQAFDSDVFVSVRKAITKARTVGRVVPNAVLMNPLDVETVDLARETGGRFYGAGPFAMGPRTLWSLPIVESETIAAGTAVVGDFSKAVLWDREDTTVTFSDSHADFFVRNLVAVLVEERVAFGVTRPAAFVKTTVAG